MEPLNNTNQTIDVAPAVSVPKKFNDAVTQEEGFSSRGSAIFKVTKDIQSPNYKKGTTGWILKSNGQSEFNNPI
jgi:hypothetical protein